MKAKVVAIHSMLFRKGLISQRHILPAAKLVEIPPGVDFSLINHVKKNIKKNLFKNSIRIGFIGTLFWWQGVDILAQAIILLKKRIPNLKLVIIGDGPLRSLVERICKKHNLSYEVTGFLSHEEALKHAATLDILVLPRKRTLTTELNIPIKVVEAWALGIPVIITRHKVFLKKGLRDREHVLYCEPDPRDIAEKILLLLKDAQLRKNLVENGLKVAKEFNYDRIAKMLLNALNFKLPSAF